MKNTSAPFWGGNFTRLGTRVLRFVENRLKKRGHQIITYDPLELKFPILEKPVRCFVVVSLLSRLYAAVL